MKKAERAKFDAQHGEFVELVRGIHAATSTMRDLLNCGDPQTEVKAARFILTFNNRMMKEQIIKRVERIESQHRL